MLGAIYIGLSGMTAYSKGLQTISNNVSNLNSPGFKSTSVSFNDVFGFGRGVSGSATTRYNGQGVRIADSVINFAKGDLRQSENDLDLAIDGDGFLVLQDKGERFYTRTGQFITDDDGYIVEQTTKYRLAMLNGSGGVSDINIDDERINKPEKTTEIKLDQILSSDNSAQTATISNISVYDSTGKKYVWQIVLTRAGASEPSGTWNVEIKDTSGTPRSITTAKILFAGTKISPENATLVISDTPENSEPVQVTIDFSEVDYLSLGSTSTIAVSDVNGRPAGNLTAVTIDADGKVKLSYSNGETELLGAVAIAKFRDPQNLSREGDNLYQYQGSGDVRLVASKEEGAGQLLSKRIEASNVNLSAEFSDLILIQRGFQASSQVVSVTNEMIQQLFSIRGQG